MFIGFVQLTYGYRLKKLTFTTLGASAAGYGMYYLFLAGIITTEKVMVEIAITCVAAVLGGIFMFVLRNKLEKTALFSVGASSDFMAFIHKISYPTTNNNCMEHRKLPNVGLWHCSWFISWLFNI